MDNQKAAKLISDNLKNIYGYAFARLYNKDDVDELTQEIAYEVLRSANRIKDDEAFWAFLWKVAENTFRKFIKQKERLHSLAPLPDDDTFIDAGASPEEALIENESKNECLNLLRRELSLLSKTHREVCLAFYFQNKSCKEIAEEQNISLEMVKYHLFKTRQLLKEGIGMERQFGEKSYNPAKFEFVTIFSGQFNREYRNLFNRKLPGNILHSAYYTPMTIRELSLELGVPSVYMEDEIALLEKYKLISALPGGKYQTNLVIFTSVYTLEFYSKAKELCVSKIGKIISDTKLLLPELRKIGFRGNTLDENHLLWPLLWLIMHRGHGVFENTLSDSNPDEIYSGATGINYGTDYDESGFDTEKETLVIKENDCYSFAGYSEINDRYAAAFADFGILPKKCHYSYNGSLVKDSLDSGKDEYMILTKRELAEVESMLRKQISDMAALYGELKDIAVDLMKQHAPKSVEPIVENIVGKALFFRTVGYIGKCAADSGELMISDEEKPAAVFVYEIDNDDKQEVTNNVQV